MTDLPEGFEKYLCEKYKMDSSTFNCLHENTYNSDLAAYTAGIAQGRKEQAEKDASLVRAWHMPLCGRLRVIQQEQNTLAEVILKSASVTGEQDD